jgi:hypothetical protein
MAELLHRSAGAAAQQLHALDVLIDNRELFLVNSDSPGNAGERPAKKQPTEGHKNPLAPERCRIHKTAVLGARGFLCLDATTPSVRLRKGPPPL